MAKRGKAAQTQALEEVLKQFSIRQRFAKRKNVWTVADLHSLVVLYIVCQFADLAKGIQRTVARCIPFARSANWCVEARKTAAFAFQAAFGAVQSAKDGAGTRAIPMRTAPIRAVRWRRHVILGNATAATCKFELQGRLRVVTLRDWSHVRLQEIFERARVDLDITRELHGVATGHVGHPRQLCEPRHKRSPTGLLNVLEEHKPAWCSSLCRVGPRIKLLCCSSSSSLPTLLLEWTL